jgi:hypothetical protein
MADRATVVTALFEDSEGVERAYEIAMESGYEKDDFNVVMSDGTRKRYFSEDRPVETDLGRKVAEGGELGGPTGGRIGIVIPIVAAVGAALVVPGIGLVAAGPIAVALAGAGAAGLAAGLIGAMGDWGIPEERVQAYEKAIHDGLILVGVKARSAEDASEIAGLWQAAGARQLHV